MKIADNNGYGSRKINLIALKDAAEDYMLSYLNVAFPGVDVKSINTTLNPVQTTPGLLTRSTVLMYTLYFTIVYHPSGCDDGLITITSVFPGDILLTQLGSDDFVPAFREDEARIGALIISANVVLAPTPDPTPHPISFQQHLPLPFQRHLQLSNQRRFSWQYRNISDS